MAQEVKKTKKAPTAKAKTAKKESILSEMTITPKKRILVAASECAPFFQTGGLADVIGSLPIALQAQGEYDVRVVCPLYQGMKSELRETLTFVESFNVPLSWRNLYCGIFKTVKDGVVYYFIDNWRVVYFPDPFSRKKIFVKIFLFRKKF